MRERIIVYKHTNLENGKSYIGLTGQDVRQRWRKGKGYAKCSLFNRAIQKYGWDGFSHEVLGEYETRSEASEAEKRFIALLKTNQREFGYNLESGGFDKGGIAPETREKLRVASSRKHTAEQIEKSAAGHRGLKHTEETRKKMSDAQKRIAMSEQGKAKLRRLKDITSKPVQKIGDSGEILAEYPSIEEAARQEGVASSGISRACCGVQKRSAGYMWKMKPCGRCFQ